MGKVCEVQNTPYGQYIILKHPTLYKGHSPVKLKSLVQLSLNTSQTITLYDDLMITGSLETIEGPMNPSDFDNKSYLRSKNVVAKIKVQQIEMIRSNTPWVEKLQCFISGKIDTLFQYKDQGIMRALLLGDDTVLDRKSVV